MTVRQDYYYPNIEKSLVGIVELCVASVFRGGDKFYKGKKDFIVKAIQNQIELEIKKNPELEKSINQKIMNENDDYNNDGVITPVSAKQKRGGNRIHVAK
jgi:hypothetical protein